MDGDAQLEMEIGCHLQIVKEAFQRHADFLMVIDSQQNELQIFKHQLFGLLRRHELPQKVQRYLTKAFMRHCLDTISKEILEFDEGVR